MSPAEFDEPTTQVPAPGTVTEDRVLENLKAVVDPEVGVDIVNMGLIYGVDISGPKVHIKMTLTTMGCPATALLEFQAKEAVGCIDGVDEVTLEWTFDPPWTPDSMTEEGRDQMAAMGYW